MRALADTDLLSLLRAALPEVRAIYRFGSRATGEARNDSDLDIAVLLPGRADPVRLWEIAEALAVRLGVDVDLVDLIAASTVLQYQIVTTGQRLFAIDAEVDFYEAFIVSEMLALREARAPLVADIVAEGRIHGR